MSIKEKIAYHRSQIRDHNEAIDNLIENCSHVLKPLKQEQLKDKWMSVGASCEECGKYFGWRCKKSPDGVCHYAEDGEKVELINGELVDVPKEPSIDYCVFCGMPEERK